MMPTATYQAPRSFSVAAEGRRPRATSGQTGFTSTSSTAKQRPMVAMSPSTMASTLRKPFLCSARTITVSSAVGGGDPRRERAAQEQVEREGAAEHLGQIAGDDAELGQGPEAQVDRP